MALTKTDKIYIGSLFDKLQGRMDGFEGRIDKFEVKLDKLEGNVMKNSIDIEKNSKDILKLFEISHKNGILLEEIRDHVKLIAEGHMGLVKRLDDHEMRTEVLEKRP